MKELIFADERSIKCENGKLLVRVIAKVTRLTEQDILPNGERKSGGYWAEVTVIINAPGAMGQVIKENGGYSKTKINVVQKIAGALWRAQLKAETRIEFLEDIYCNENNSGKVLQALINACYTVGVQASVAKAALCLD